MVMLFSATTASAASSLLAALFLGAVLSSVYTKAVRPWAQGLNVLNGLISQTVMLLVINYGDVTDPVGTPVIWVVVAASAIGFAAIIGISGALDYKLASASALRRAESGKQGA
jgi:hypothetical protein